MNGGLSTVRSLLAPEVGQEDSIAWARAGMRRLMEESKDGGIGLAYNWNRQDAYAEREDRLLSKPKHPDLRGFGEDT